MNASVETLDRADTARLLCKLLIAFDADPYAHVAVFHVAHGHVCAGSALQAGAPLAQHLRPWPVAYSWRFGVPLIDGGTVRLIGMGQARDLILTGR